MSRLVFISVAVNKYFLKECSMTQVFLDLLKSQIRSLVIVMCSKYDEYLIDNFCFYVDIHNVKNDITD